MAKVIVGLYDHIEDARQVVEGLVNSGFPHDGISLVAADTMGEYSRYADVPGKGFSTGEASAAGVGAVVGGLSHLLVGLGILAIPGTGQVLAAGPLVSELAGTGEGLAPSSLSGALEELGIPKEQAGRFAEGVRRGGVLLTMATADELVSQAVDLMDRFNPVDIDERYEEWQQAENGADTTIGPGSAGLEAWEPFFRKHYQDSFQLQDRSFAELHPAYAYGYALASDPRFQNKDWSEIEPEARLEWERTYLDNPWEDFKDAVRDAWYTVANPHPSER